MTALLRFDASPQVDGSHSRLITGKFVAGRMIKTPEGATLSWDLAKASMLHLGGVATTALATRSMSSLDFVTPNLEGSSSVIGVQKVDIHSIDDAALNPAKAKIATAEFPQRIEPIQAN